MDFVGEEAIGQARAKRTRFLPRSRSAWISGQESWPASLHGSSRSRGCSREGLDTSSGELRSIGSDRHGLEKKRRKVR